jgi:tetratricopeptide (TPR) repeat protein
VAGVVDRNIVQKVVVTKKEHFFDRKLLWFTALILAVTILIYVYPPGYRSLAGENFSGVRGVFSENGNSSLSPNSVDSSAGLSANRAAFWLELGHDLNSRGLYREAVLYYAKYLSVAGEGSESAALAFKTGDICKDQLKDYEQAAKFYLQVRYFDKESPLLQKTGLRIVACLEALGKTRESQSQLDQMTNVDRKNSPKNPMSPIVAETGSRDFTLADIDDGIASLHPDVRKNYEGPSGRMLFLQQQLLLPHLLYELGKKDGTDQSSEVLSKLEDLRESLVVQEVIKKKLKAAEKPTDEELKMFFKANEEKYKSGFDDNRQAIFSDYINFRSTQQIGRLMEEQMKIQRVRLYTSALRSDGDLSVSSHVAPSQKFTIPKAAGPSSSEPVVVESSVPAVSATSGVSRVLSPKDSSGEVE